MGAAICSAVNDWIIEHWLNKEPRLRASIVVPAQAPSLAVEEIERLAHDRRFVQVLMPAACELMLGRGYYWPIYEAAARHGLPVGIHAGSMYRYAPTSTGWPSHYLQDYITNNQLFEGQLLSLVSNGVFVKFPDLKFVFIESGVSWLPHFIWRAIKTWRGVRAEVPWVKQSPADIIRNNIRVTTQPFDAPDAATVARIVEQIDCPEMFLFSSDYPHWQFDGEAITPPGLPDALLQRMRIDKPARHLSPLEGDRVMNAPVNVLQHSTEAGSRYGVIDCDIHPFPKPGALNQYLSERWRNHVAEYGQMVCGIYAGRGNYPRFQPIPVTPGFVSSGWRATWLRC